MKSILKTTLNKNLPLIKKIYPVLLILALMVPLRFINLGYSEYICDESVALSYLKLNGSFYSWDFLLLQHKGPMQYLIAGITYLLSGSVFNEHIYRVPFAVINISSIVVLYFFLKNVVKSSFGAFFGALMLGFNGMTVAFGRIFQYQSLNLLFSFLSLYFFSNIKIEKGKNNEKKIIKNSLLGTLFFCLSVLSHWDAIFILPYIVYVLLKGVFLGKSYDNKFKIKLIILNCVLLFALTVFYLIPYVSNFVGSSENQEYFQKRVNPGEINFVKIKERLDFILFRMRVYNPILFVEYVGWILFFSLVFIKKTWLYLSWFFIELCIFIFVFTNHGTHIYNVFIPLSVILAFTVTEIQNLLFYRWKKKKKLVILLSTAFLVVISGVLFYQSLVLFVDHRTEYPWRDKKVLGFEVGKYTARERRKYLTNNKIGFPLNRRWLEIEKVMSAYEKENGIPVGTLGIETNENECPVNFYTGRELSFDKNRFIVGIKYPLSMANDYKGFSIVKKKQLLEVVRDDKGDTTAVVYVTSK